DYYCMIWHNTYWVF
nr:immunoglobulin light chain junction region [Macaca mulatta]